MPLIKSLKISLLKPSRIVELSFGKITSHKVINNRTLKPEPGGLLDPRIFGPFLNYECYCGKYKGKENKGQKCERCEVLIGEKNLQRWRPGHIELPVPVTNIAVFKILATNLSKLLGISAKKLEDIIYFNAYVIIDNNLISSLKKEKILEKKFNQSQIDSILQEIIQEKKLAENILEKAEQLQKKIAANKNKKEETTDTIFSEDYLDFLEKHCGVKISTGTEALQELLTGINVEAELAKEKKIAKEMPQKVNREKLKFLQEEDVIATNQHNNLIYRIILRCERLNYYLGLKDSGILFRDILHNEKRGLQKAIDQMIYGSAYKQSGVKSLLQSLSGKEGILRRYSLGKRVDYSARSVIVPNPNLLLDQIGLPVKMALTLCKPFLIRRILKEKLTFTIKEAEQMLQKEAPIIFSLLTEIIQEHLVIVNRAPSLHGPSVQATRIVLTLGHSIELHPLITTALNADFDGDQVAIYLILTEKARKEAEELFLSSHLIIDRKNGQLITIPSQDMILGIYYLTKEAKRKKPIFFNEISNIYKSQGKGKISLHDLIIIPAPLVGRQLATSQNQFLFTTLGKIIFNRILPPSFPYYINDLKAYNEENNQEELITFLNKLALMTPRSEMVEFLDHLKKAGFDYSTRSGISISPFELENIVPDKEKILAAAEKKLVQIAEHFTQEECKEKLKEKLVANLAKRKQTSFYHIWDSGARASDESLTQIAGMRGNITDYSGEVKETAITSSLWEGLTPFEFFISDFGATKGMIDTALKTAEAGYLTRRLVESAQSLIILAPDCGTNSIMSLTENDLPLKKRIYGRYLAQDVSDKKGKVILMRNTLLLEKEIKTLQIHKVMEVGVFSPLTCQLVDGICQKCYGLDLGRPGEPVSLGTAVGIIAAQSLGEPGTQLTMRTFHSGGVSGDEDITQGLPKVKQILDNIKPKKDEKTILAELSGEIISIEEKKIRQKNEEGGETKTYSLGKEITARVKPGDFVKKGERLTGGKIDLEEYLEIMGREKCQEYIREGVRKVYDHQGIDINEKHIEIFARQMLSKVKIIDSGDSDYLVGDLVNCQQLAKVNQELLSQQKKPVIYKNIILSLKDLASQPDSFLAGISFQNALKSLVNYCLYQPVDDLKGCKENLIAGQLAPVGTGFKEREKFQRSKDKGTKK
ncbi:7896_t:CDS:2 [Racocetra fulgida]|uniref:DNA-directed RNA polymerase subunit n=1 Tax=Racocetra fulgida TaxID=60492 RepID=A0A9N8YRU4_9GLOM|nr:7896_t:CDS:2 [Racocetra fulgida]